jgi:hypothetical protein
MLGNLIKAILLCRLTSESPPLCHYVRSFVRDAGALGTAARAAAALAASGTRPAVESGSSPSGAAGFGGGTAPCLLAGQVHNTYERLAPRGKRTVAAAQGDPVSPDQSHLPSSSLVTKRPKPSWQQPGTSVLYQRRLRATEKAQLAVPQRQPNQQHQIQRNKKDVGAPRDAGSAEAVVERHHTLQDEELSAELDALLSGDGDRVVKAEGTTGDATPYHGASPSEASHGRGADGDGGHCNGGDWMPIAKRKQGVQLDKQQDMPAAVTVAASTASGQHAALAHGAPVPALAALRPRCGDCSDDAEAQRVGEGIGSPGAGTHDNGLGEGDIEGETEEEEDDDDMQLWAAVGSVSRSDCAPTSAALKPLPPPATTGNSASGRTGATANAQSIAALQPTVVGSDRVVPAAAPGIRPAGVQGGEIDDEDEDAHLRCSDDEASDGLGLEDGLC